MKYFKEGLVAIVSLFASGTLLAQDTTPKPAPKTNNTTVAQAQTPPSGGASTGAEAGGAATGISTGTAVAIGVGVAAVAAAAASGGGGGSTTTHH